jgi:RNA polymerase sigma-70 factor, ECF subfamily
MSGLQAHEPPVQALSDAQQLWSDYRPRLVVFARTFGGAAAASPEDTAHDIVERAIERLSLFDGRHAFSTWLYRLARNYCIDVNRRTRRRRDIFSRHAPVFAGDHPAMPGPSEQLDRTESLAAVGAAIAGLAPDDRQIAFLRYFEELSIAEIGDVMHKPTGTVKYRLHVMLNQLREALDGGPE